MRRAILIAVALIPLSAVSAATLNGKAEIVDGDTIKVGGLPVRLYGIDAPEGLQTCKRKAKAYACGKEATKALADLIKGRPVSCEIVGKDDFGRILGTCFAGNTSLNAAMVSSGWALAFLKYSDRYAAEQRAAKTSQAGLWSGVFEKPWEWRLGKSQAAESAQGCVIKGNISRDGERIYHMPFQHFYSRTKIDKGKGERWFCTEQEARSAGWRRALR
jgi:endonuclease YncB( thermonuclease family)